MKIYVKQPAVIENCYKSPSIRSWEDIILKWVVIAVAFLIAISAITLCVAHLMKKPHCTPAIITTINFTAAQHSDMDTYKVQAQDVEGGYSLFEKANETQICQADVLLGSQQMRKHNTKLVCYYSFPGTGGLMPDKIDPFLCTHINIAAVGIENSKLEPLSEERQQIIKSLVGLKILNKDLKVILSVAGMPGGFGDMVSNSSSRRMFIKDLLLKVTYYSLDGVDFDWEFPSWPGKISERKKFIIFLKELRTEILKNQLNIIISVAVAAPKVIVDVSYDIPEMNKLTNAENHGWSAPASGYGKIGRNGFVSYPEVCQFLRSAESKYKFDKNLEVPYTYQGLEWISYDNVCSIMYKAKYIVSGSYGGAMVFSLNEDDHQGVCAGTKFLLTTQIRNILGVSLQ